MHVAGADTAWTLETRTSEHGLFRCSFVCVDGYFMLLSHVFDCLGTA